MKKLVSSFLILILVASVLVGCGGAKYKDGTYKAAYKDFDDHGWKAFVEITITDNKITDAVFDYVNEEGELKSEDEEYNKIMMEASGSSPEEFSRELPKDLIEKQDIKKVDMITGATGSVENFKKLGEVALKNAKAGNTADAEVDYD
ncbi:MAG: FMN-binding protein [Clostridiales bacterium]|nr:FMN-binding protein [Clostridiales bacterium]